MCREIRASKDLEQVRIVILTAKGQALGDAQKLDIGADEYIDKPFAPRAVLDCINRLLYQDLFKEYSE